MDQKTSPLWYLQESHFTYRDTDKKGQIKIRHVNTNQKKARVTVLISDITDVRAMKIIRDKEEHYVMIKGSIPQ